MNSGDENSYNQQLKHRGLNTQTNKLNKITRGHGKSKTPGETNNQDKEHL